MATAIKTILNTQSNKDGFYNIDCDFCGLKSNLIIPKASAIWSKDNLFFRSLILDLNGNVVSSGWPKFFNYGEKSVLYPTPSEYDDWLIQEKVDGSLVIADFVNNQFNMRTRGCSSYLQQSNSKDFEVLPKKFPKVISFLQSNSQFSLLFEIVTPNNVIVIRPPEVLFYFIGAINKNDLTIASRETLLDIWRAIGCPPMPKTYQIENIKNLDSLNQLIKQWNNSEGVVVVYNKNQNRIKIKSDWYLFRHKVKTTFNSKSNLIEFYVSNELPSFDSFFKKIETEFDFELATQLKNDIFEICSAGELAKKFIENISNAVCDIRNIESRKSQAEILKNSYGANASYGFCILDNRAITNQQWIKLINQQLIKLT